MESTLSKNTFTDLTQLPAIERHSEHGGTGPITFRRVMDGDQFESPVDFVDYTVIPPGSTIGRHTHSGNEELYLVLSGNPLINVNGSEQRVKPGSVSIVRSGEWHQLRNDTQEEVSIFVFQVRIPR